MWNKNYKSVENELQICRKRITSRVKTNYMSCRKRITSPVENELQVLSNENELQVLENQLQLLQTQITIPQAQNAKLHKDWVVGAQRRSGLSIGLRCSTRGSIPGKLKKKKATICRKRATSLFAPRFFTMISVAS